MWSASSTKTKAWIEASSGLTNGPVISAHIGRVVGGWICQNARICMQNHDLQLLCTFMLFIIRHETWYRRIFTIACVAEIDHCLSHFSQIEHDAKWVQRVAYHLNHGTSVKVVVEFGKSLKGYTINQLKMRNQKKCMQLNTIETSWKFSKRRSCTQPSTVHPRPHLNPCAFCGSLGVWQAEWAHKKQRHVSCGCT